MTSFNHGGWRRPTLALRRTAATTWRFFAPHASRAALRAQLFPAAVSLLSFTVSCIVFGPQVGVISMLGAMVPFWETGRPLWARIRTGVLVTAGLCACMAVGVLVAPHRWAVIPACLLVIALVGTVYQTFMLTNGPSPGMMFYAAAVGSFFGALPGIGWNLVVVTAFSATVAWILLLLPVLFRPHVPGRTAVAAARRAVSTFRDAPPRERRRTRNAAAGAIARAGITLHSAHPAHRSAPHRLLRRDLEGVASDFVAVFGEATPQDAPRIVPGRPDWRYLVRRALRSHSIEWFITWRMVLAAGLAATASTLLGIGHPYWAIITATIVLNQWADSRTSILRAAHRTVGTLIGVGLTELIMSLHPSIGVTVVLIAVTMGGMYVLLPANYALALISITPMALLANAVSAGWDGGTAIDRLLDTCLAAVAAILVMWISGWGFPRRLVIAQSRRLIAATKSAATRAREAAPLELLHELTRHQNVLERAHHSRPDPAMAPLVTAEHAAADRGYETLARVWPDAVDRR